MKIMKKKGMSKGERELLDNEIEVLKNLDHPNALQLHVYLQEESQCLLITELCQGGNL